MSERNLILERFKTVIQAQSTFKYVDVNRATPIPNISNHPMPSAFIYSGGEIRVKDDRAVIGQETWDWGVFVEVWCKGSNFSTETLLKTVHDAVYVDSALTTPGTLGVLAKSITRASASDLLMDPAAELKGVMIEFSVLYDNTWGVM